MKPGRTPAPGCADANAQLHAATRALIQAGITPTPQWLALVRSGRADEALLDTAWLRYLAAIERWIDAQQYQEAA